jgi:hypothetical protein
VKGRHREDRRGHRAQSRAAFCQRPKTFAIGEEIAGVTLEVEMSFEPRLAQGREQLVDGVYRLEMRTKRA